MGRSHFDAPHSLLLEPPPSKESLAYPQTPLLKGRDAVANATSGSGTMVLAVAFIVIGCNCFAYPASVAASWTAPRVQSVM